MKEIKETKLSNTSKELISQKFKPMEAESDKKLNCNGTSGDNHNNSKFNKSSESVNKFIT